MTKFARFAAIETTLKKLGFGPSRHGEWLNSPMTADGFLRVCLIPDDHHLELYRFDRHECLDWSLKLEIGLPGAVLAAALNAALAEVGFGAVPQLLAA